MLRQTRSTWLSCFYFSSAAGRACSFAGNCHAPPSVPLDPPLPKDWDNLLLCPPSSFFNLAATLFQSTSTEVQVRCSSSLPATPAASLKRKGASCCDWAEGGSYFSLMLTPPSPPKLTFQNIPWFQLFTLTGRLLQQLWLSRSLARSWTSHWPAVAIWAVRPTHFSGWSKEASSNVLMHSPYENRNLLCGL